MDPLALSNTQREYAASHVTSDLRYLFRSSNYWFSFFHVPRFFGTFFDPVARDRMQPSLILAACALATFWQSSEIGRGKHGRDLALRLRDEAGGALQASLDAGWIDETLAQAAWVSLCFIRAFIVFNDTSFRCWPSLRFAPTRCIQPTVRHRRC